jgi:hypothetical protein
MNESVGAKTELPVKAKRGRPPKTIENADYLQATMVHLQKRKKPQKLTPQTVDRILEAVRTGCYFDSAAACAGISKSTLFDWMKKGEGGVEPYATFRQQMLAAEDECEEEVVKIWKAHMPKNWQAAAAFLERRRPEKWSRRDYSKVENQTDIKMQVMYVNEWRGDPQIIDVTPVKEIVDTNGGDKHDSAGEKAEGQDNTVAEASPASDSNTDESGEK